MISIAMTIFDPSGHVTIMDTSKCNFGKKPARVSRSATLDGGAVITHSGVSHGDRTFTLDCQISEAQETAINYIHENATSVLVSCSEGVFLGAISDLETYEGKLKATILIKSKEN